MKVLPKLFFGSKQRGFTTLANSAQAKKRVRQAEQRRQRNVSRRSMLRTYIKKVVTAIKGGNQAEAQTAYQTAVPILDRMAGKGIIHKNKAARHKSRLYAHIKKMQPAEAS